jgi:hypothetical protein
LSDELSERWSLLADDLALLAGRIDAGKLGFVVQLAFWRQRGRFLDEEADAAPRWSLILPPRSGAALRRRTGRLGREKHVGRQTE